MFALFGHEATCSLVSFPYTSAQRVEHYEIAAYGTARTLADELGHTDTASILDSTLDEESAADKTLTKIATGGMFPQRSHQGGRGAQLTRAGVRGPGRPYVGRPSPDPAVTDDLVLDLSVPERDRGPLPGARSGE